MTETNKQSDEESLNSIRSLLISKGIEKKGPVTLREVLYVVLYLSSLIYGVHEINDDIVTLEIRIESRFETLSNRIDQILLNRDDND